MSRWADMPSGEPYDWSPAARGESPYDNIDFEVDLGCGRRKKGRIGVDRYPAEGVDIVCDLETLTGYIGRGVNYGDGLSRFEGNLPFEDSSVESIISHHALEHIGEGFIPLMDECYRILKPGGIFRIITPLFPSWSAVSDPDHKRYFMAGPAEGREHTTLDSFCGTPGDTPQNCWLASFSVPYTTARFVRVDLAYTPPVAPELQWTPADSREIRVALETVK